MPEGRTPKSFSARSFAENFDEDAIKNAVRYCRALGVKTYMTVNIQLSDRELGEAAETIFRAYRYGIDAFIVADVGLANYVHTVCPEIELHASTQATGLYGVETYGDEKCEKRRYKHRRHADEHRIFKAHQKALIFDNLCKISDAELKNLSADGFKTAVIFEKRHAHGVYYGPHRENKQQDYRRPEIEPRFPLLFAFDHFYTSK